MDGRSSILRDLLFSCLGAYSEQLTFGVASNVRLKCASYLLSPACLPSFKDFWYNATKCFGARQSLAKCEKSPHLWHLLSFLGLALSPFHLCELGLCFGLCFRWPDLFFGAGPLNLLFLAFFCTLCTSGKGAKPTGRLWWFFRRSSSCFFLLETMYE